MDGRCTGSQLKNLIQQWKHSAAGPARRMYHPTVEGYLVRYAVAKRGAAHPAQSSKDEAEAVRR